MPLALRIRRAASLLAVLAVVTGLLYVKAVPCVFARVCHIPCPGCGSSRAVLALLSGDLHGVLTYNPLGPVVAILLGVFGVQALASVLRYGDFREVPHGRIGRALVVISFVVGAAEVVLWIARFFGVLGGPVPV